MGFDISKECIYSTALGEELAEKDYKDISGSDRQYTRKGERTNTNIMLEHNFIFGGFTLSAGVLANKNTGLDNDFRFYPGVDMSYRPNDNWKFYASWNKAVRMPTYTDLYMSNAVQQGDINLNQMCIRDRMIPASRSHSMVPTYSLFLAPWAILLI